MNLNALNWEERCSVGVYQYKWFGERDYQDLCIGHVFAVFVALSGKEACTLDVSQ